jgi:mono/diheme cytochrome c family protein
MAPRAPRLLTTFSAAALLVFAAPEPASRGGSSGFEQSVQPVLKRNCHGCHNPALKSGDLDLASFKDASSIATGLAEWEKVATKLRDGTMPPKGVPRPPQADVEAAAAWIQSEIQRIELAAKPDPGRVTARRLNRAEYDNTIRDLLGLDLRLAGEFPQDDSGYGFDNIGDVLSLSPVLFEKYINAAETAVKTALFGPGEVKPSVIRSQPPGREFELLPKAQKEYDETGLSMPNALHATMRFPADGEYTFRAALEGRRPAGSEPVNVGIWIDGKQAATLTIDAKPDFASIDLFGAQAETRLSLPAGEHWVAASILKIYEGLPPEYEGPNPTRRPVPPARDPLARVRIPPDATPEQADKIKKEAIRRAQLFRVPANRVWVHWVEAVGPYEAKPVPAAETRRRILTCGHLDGKHAAPCDRAVIGAFARRAFRRTLAAGELRPYVNLAAQARRDGASYDESLAAALQAILVSPDFLYRIEKTTAAGPEASAKPIDHFALASRLSYFLWSSMPDDELLRVAGNGTLRRPAVLEAQVRRMLRDPKAAALTANFAGQWLELRRLESVAPDREKFPQFDEYLRMSMRQETERFFTNLLREDRSIVALLNGRYSFLNEKLAAFYGIEGVKGPEFRRVDFDAATPRGGILTHASVLTVSSYATRTSPVLRGKWILENLLNEPVPPPPPNVQLLEEAKIGVGASLRKQMEEHRTNPACASCHAKMDPIGFGFENYSAIGQWRHKDGEFAIDASGILPDGREFRGPADFTSLVVGDKDKFAEAVAEKMLTYALGRGLERYDRRTVREIARKSAGGGYRFSSMVLEIVKSLPFQMTRPDRANKEESRKQ